MRFNRDASCFLLNHAFGPFSPNPASQFSCPRLAVHQTSRASRRFLKSGTGDCRTPNPGLVLNAVSSPAPEIEILSLTDSWVAVNKPPGMLVHHTKLYHANAGETYLVDHVSRLVSERKGVSVAVKPVQRLDRPTSGVMVFALGDSSSASQLQAALQSPDTEKVYWAIASGADMPEQWVNDHPLTDLTGKHRRRRASRTEIRQLARLDTSDVSIVSARIRTGRRHQIRRHLSYSRHPILGDTSYGKGEVNRRARTLFGVNRCCLHAWCLSFEDPVTHQPVRVEVAIPDDLREVLRRFPDHDACKTESAWNAS